jgi:hypothetical protein
MIIECIAVGVTGVFVGIVLVGQGITAQSEENRKLKQELSHHKKVGNLHIGQVVYACKYNSFYMGEITKITHSTDETTIELNNKEIFRNCHIYTDKNKALQQIKI